MSDTVRQQYIERFNDGMSPGEAMRAHANELLVGEQPYESLANGSLNPKPRSVYHLHHQWYTDHFGSAVDPLAKLPTAFKVPESGTVWFRLAVLFIQL